MGEKRKAYAPNRSATFTFYEALWGLVSLILPKYFYLEIEVSNSNSSRVNDVIALQ
jgi:hypothetical protein